MTPFRLLILLLVFSSPLIAAPPATLAYQGRLANSAGQPVTATLPITFRLYDVSSGGSALWNETQPAVGIDGGNFTVELGLVTPLPRALFGRQLYLGIQVGADGEMSPRPPLTAAPFALRAAGTLARTIEVPAEGSAAENGTALLAAVTAAAGASAAVPVQILLDAGVYDLGSSRIDLPSHVTLAGQGRSVTRVESNNDRGTVLMDSFSTVRNLTARNTGIPAAAMENAVGLGSSFATLSGGSVTPVQGIVIEDAAGESLAATGSTGARQGIWFCASHSTLRRAAGRGEGGTFAFGMRADCTNSEATTIDGLELEARGASAGVRGAYIAGGGTWKGIRIIVETAASLDSAYGLRLFTSALDVGAGLIDLMVKMAGNNIDSTVVNSIYEAVRVDSGDYIFDGLFVNMEGVRAQSLAGLRIIAIPSGPNPIPVVEVRDLRLFLAGIQRASLGPGAIHGVWANNAAARIQNGRIEVRCEAGGFNACYGVRRQQNPPGLQPGALTLDQVHIEVGHADPMDTSAQSRAYHGVGAVAIHNSTLRVLLSPDGETHATVSADGAGGDVPAFLVSGSTLEVIGAVPENGGCYLAQGGGVVELYGNHVRGGTCIGAGSQTCAGNTRRGFGFLASTCQ